MNSKSGNLRRNIISVASGLALEGLKPWVYTITPFLIERPFEQIKLDINQQKANVKHELCRLSHAWTTHVS